MIPSKIACAKISRTAVYKTSQELFSPVDFREALTRKCSMRKVLLKNLLNLLENTCAGVSFQ